MYQTGGPGLDYTQFSQYQPGQPGYLQFDLNQQAQLGAQQQIMQTNQANQLGQSAGSFGPIGAIIGGATSIGNQIGQADLQRNLKFDAEGNLQDERALRNTFVRGSFFDPIGTGMNALQDPDASVGEKVGSFLGFGAAFAGKRAKRAEERAKKEFRRRSEDQLRQTRTAQLGPQRQYSFEYGGNLFQYPQGEILTGSQEIGMEYNYGGYITEADILEEYAGGGIHIKPSKRGTFKAQASKMNMGVQEAAEKILSAPKGRYSAAMRKKANFAKNFAKEYGGSIEYATGGKFNKSEITKGALEELEHTSSKREARKIAKDHLMEHPDYYSRLKEAGLADAYGYGGDLATGGNSEGTMMIGRGYNAYGDYGYGGKQMYYGGGKMPYKGRAVPDYYPANDTYAMIEKEPANFTEYEVGGTHEENPNGGIPLGPKALVEQGEVKYSSEKYGDYIFTNRF